MKALLLAILVVFVPLSLVTIGGGQTVVADIHRQVVDVHHWMSEAQFVDAFAISRMSPGPGSLLVTLIGFNVAGIWGAVVGTFAIFMPTAFLVYWIAALWARHEGAVWQQVVDESLRPVAAGMILASVYVLLQALEGGWLARAITIASTGSLMVTRINPILLLTLGAVVFAGVRLAFAG